MDTLSTKKIISSILDDERFYKDFKAMLNELIDNELAKEAFDMDCDLIEACTDMLIELEQGNNENGFSVIIPPVKSNKIIEACSKHSFKSLSRGMRASVIASVILLSAVTCNAAVYKISGYNIAHEVAVSISQKLNDWGIISYADDNNEIVVEEIPTGSENVDAGFDEEEKTTTKPAETTTKPTGSESIDAGIKDDEPTGSENIDVGFEEEETTIRPVIPAVKQYTISFDSDGGSSVPDKTVTYRREIGDLPVPVKEGYVFNGWYNIDIAYKFKSYAGVVTVKEAIPIESTAIYNLERDAVLTAKWTPICTVTFDAGEGQCDVKQLQTNSEGKISELPVPVREGYVFDYWYYFKMPKVVVVTTDTVFSQDITLKAHYTEDIRDFTLTFDPNGGECDVREMPVVYGETYGTLPVPAREGYIFAGWYKGDNVGYAEITEDTIHTVRKDLTVYALWAEDVYTVSFDSNGGNDISAVKTVYLGQHFGTLPEPSMPGYDFTGWYYGDECYTETSLVPTLEGTKEITLTAHWTPAPVSITFDGNGGTVESFNKKFYYLSAYGELPEAYGAGYELEGWYTEPDGGVKINPEDIIDSYEPITLYAHWTEIPECAVVTVHTNRSVEEVYDLNYTVGDTLGDLEVPKYTTSTERSYTEFLGWFDDRYYGNELSADTVITEDMDVYAHWGIYGALKNMVEIKISNLKEVYNLNEEIRLDELTVTLSAAGETSDLTELINSDGIENHFLGNDTSTVGDHTLIFRMAYTDFSYIGLGTIYMEQTADFKVVDCEHSTWHIENYNAPRCNKKGYSGDTVCDDCRYVLAEGEELEKVPHDENTETVLKRAAEPTCTTDGYTGDVCCAVCNQIFVKGEVIPKLNHPSSHKERVYDATCSAKGYTGDTICDICGARLECGEYIDKIPHGETILVGAKEPTCAEYGYTGDYLCKECDEISQWGERIDKLPHGETELINEQEATCAQPGYTGDIVCANCGEIITKGQSIPQLNHPSTTIANVKEATCSEEGNTGDTVCTVCGEVIIKGEAIPKTEHNQVFGFSNASLGQNGYRGYYCSVCGELISGTKINAIASIEMSQTEFIFQAKEQTPTVTVTDSTGAVLSSSNYTLTYMGDKMSVGTQTIRLVFRGNYTGTHYLEYEIKAPAFGICGITKDSAGFYVDWVRVADAEGYQIKLMTDSQTYFDTNVGKDAKNCGFPITYYAKGFYVVVRSFKTETVDGVETTVYSEWSDRFYVK